MNPMSIVEIKNLSRPLHQPLQVAYCKDFGCKLRGLTFRRALAMDEGLLMDNLRESKLDSAIHMMGVFFDLGIIWLGEDLKVIDRQFARRWLSILSPSRPARYILEVHPDRLGEFEIGHEISY
ncbi:MAG: hypothetical protein EPO32_00255 [Anaerolineae bacterium]|nr:MAG: hypothetical protein EPO32_00255 [Anaerolineae bacterium]